MDFHKKISRRTGNMQSQIGCKRLSTKGGFRGYLLTGIEITNVESFVVNHCTQGL